MICRARSCLQSLSPRGSPFGERGPVCHLWSLGLFAELGGIRRGRSCCCLWCQPRAFLWVLLFAELLGVDAIISGCPESVAVARIVRGAPPPPRLQSPSQLALPCLQVWLPQCGTSHLCCYHRASSLYCCCLCSGVQSLLMSVPLFAEPLTGCDAIADPDAASTFPIDHQNPTESPSLISGNHDPPNPDTCSHLPPKYPPTFFEHQLLGPPKTNPSPLPPLPVPPEGHHNLLLGA